MRALSTLLNLDVVDSPREIRDLVPKLSNRQPPLEVAPPGATLPDTVAVTGAQADSRGCQRPSAGRPGVSGARIARGSTNTCSQPTV